MDAHGECSDSRGIRYSRTVIRRPPTWSVISRLVVVGTMNPAQLV